MIDIHCTCNELVLWEGDPEAPEIKFPAKDHLDLGEARFGISRIHAVLGDGFIGVIRPSGGLNGKESNGLPAGNMVGSRDVDCKANNIVNVEVVQVAGVDGNVDNQICPFFERDVVIKEGLWWD